MKTIAIILVLCLCCYIMFGITSPMNALNGLVEAGKGLVNGFTNLYNKLPEWLQFLPWGVTAIC